MTSRDPQRCCEAVLSAILATAWLLVLSVKLLVKEMFPLHKDHTFAVYKPWPTYCGVDVANVVVLL